MTRKLDTVESQVRKADQDNPLGMARARLWVEKQANTWLKRRVAHLEVLLEEMHLELGKVFKSKDPKTLRNAQRLIELAHPDGHPWAGGKR